jgi:hypothetical protein
MNHLVSPFADAVSIVSLAVTAVVALVASGTVVVIVCTWFWRQLSWLDGQGREADRKALKLSAERCAPTYDREGWQ